MVSIEDFEGEQYKVFKKDAEQLIKDYQAGRYRTEIKEIKVRIENVMRLTNGNPRVYLELCSLYKFLTDLYKTPYIKNMIDFAENLGFTFYLPEEMNTDLDMESFAGSILHTRKIQNTFDINQYLVVSFAKQVHQGSQTKPFFLTIPVLFHTGSLLYSQLTVAREYDILGGITHLETLAKP